MRMVSLFFTVISSKRRAANSTTLKRKLETHGFCAEISATEAQDSWALSNVKRRSWRGIISLANAAELKSNQEID